MDTDLDKSCLKFIFMSSKKILSSKTIFRHRPAVEVNKSVGLVNLKHSVSLSENRATTKSVLRKQFSQVKHPACLPGYKQLTSVYYSNGIGGKLKLKCLNM